VSEIRTSLPSIIQFINTPGARRGRVPGQLRAMYEDPSRHPWRYYDPMVAAIRHGLRSGQLRTELAAAVRAAQAREVSDRRCRGQAEHFAEIEAGMLTVRRRTGPVALLPVPTGVWSHRDLRVKVSPHLCLERRGGVREVWFLHLKAHRINRSTADGALVIMTEAMRAVGCEATARIVDVRSGTTGFTLGRGRDLYSLSAYARAEAEAFCSLWAAGVAA